MKTRILFTAVIVAAMIPSRPVRAQDVSGTATSIGSEPRVYSTNIGYLGIENLRCNCTVSRVAGDQPTRYVFRSAPVVLGVATGSPGDGIIMKGDTILEIDGQSLLTTEGARRFSSIRVGDNVNLLVRRRGNVLKLTLRASAEPGRRVYTRISAPEADGGSGYSYEVVTPRPSRAVSGAVGPRPGVAPRARVWSSDGSEVRAVIVPANPAEASAIAMAATPAAPGVTVVPAGPGVPSARGGFGTGRYATVAVVPPMPTAWFGFSIRCSDCGWASSGRPGATPVWESDEAPELSMVATNSPASRAGLRSGDRITHIDGISILTTAGRRRFGGVKPGQKIRLTIERDGNSIVRELTLAERPEVRAAIAATRATTSTAPTPPSMRRELRYTGRLEDVTVEVFSAGGPTVERNGDTMIITVGTSVIRIKVDPKKQ